MFIAIIKIAKYDVINNITFSNVVLQLYYRINTIILKYY